MRTTEPFRLEPTEGFITVTAGYTPTVNIHEPDSIYCRQTGFPRSDHLRTYYSCSPAPGCHLTTARPSPVNYDELAHSVGTAPGRLAKSRQRLAGFHLAHTLPDQPSTLYLKRRAPTLNDNQLARHAQRCPTAAACHDEQRHVA